VEGVPLPDLRRVGDPRGALPGAERNRRRGFHNLWRTYRQLQAALAAAGVVSLGFVMDAIADRHRHRGVPTREQFRADLEPLREVCRWADGHWEFGPGVQRKWIDVRNTHKDIQLLANYLLVQYKGRVRNRVSEERR
jgi:hypothetical protein